MIISHKYKFIFIKTRKTAGTSLEAYLSPYCSDEDVFTPIQPPMPDHVPRNSRGRWNLLQEVAGAKSWLDLSLACRQWLKRQRFYNHMSARMIRARCPERIWRDYVKFTIDRDPFEKVMSQFSRRRADAGQDYDLERYFAESRLPFNLPLYTDNDGSLMVDYVLRYEDLNAECGSLFDSLGVPWSGRLSVHAKTGFRDAERLTARDLLPETYKDYIRKKFAREFTLNGYPTE